MIASATTATKRGIAKNCSDRDKEAVCFKCRKPEHLAKNCGNSEREKTEEVPVVHKSIASRSHKEVSICGAAATALIDMGSTINIIRVDVLEQVTSKVRVRESLSKINGFGGDKIEVLGCVSLDTLLDGIVYNLRTVSQQYFTILFLREHHETK